MVLLQASDALGNLSFNGHRTTIRHDRIIDIMRNSNGSFINVIERMLTVISKKFRFIDLFCGIGGMRIGLERVGGTCVYSSEINKYAIETYTANFGDDPDGDITKINASDIPDHEVLAAGFPCQPFSLAGVVKRNSMGMPSGMECSQGKLFEDIVRILRVKKPQAFLLENVKYLQSIDKGNIFRNMCRNLENAGYVISSQIIDARGCCSTTQRAALYSGI